MKAFKAPQKSLKSSWVQLAFSKPKAGSITKRSLGNRPHIFTKNRGDMFSNATSNHSNLY
jgi:hypothetical protein